jgi:hypothetical protein
MKLEAFSWLGLLYQGKLSAAVSVTECVPEQEFGNEERV